MKLKPIIWKEYEGTTHGYVGGLRMFSYFYNDFYPNGGRFKMKSVLPFPPVELNSREECQKMCQAIFQKFIAKVTE
jgi:hypothetical protein